MNNKRYRGFSQRVTAEDFNTKVAGEETTIEKEVPTSDPEPLAKEVAKVVVEEAKTEDKAEETKFELKKEEPKKAERPKIAKITCDLANIRASASLNANILSTVTKGAEFKAMPELAKNGFMAIVMGGATAYIKSDLVEVFDNPAYVANEVAGRL